MTGLNAKLMEEKLKRGWTVSDFAGYLCTTEEEFLKALKKTFKANPSRRMIARLNLNQKRRKNSHLEVTATPSIADPSENNAIPINETISELPIRGDLQELNRQSNEISKKLCSQEIRHSELVSSRKKLYDSLRDYQKLLLELKSKVQEYQSKIGCIISEINGISSDIESINIQISDSRKKLSSLKEQISELSKLNIFVYEDGEIEVENHPEIFIPDECWLNFSLELTQNEFFESLTIKQVKQLAKLIVLKDSLHSQNIQFELTFENALLESCFQKFN